MARILTRILRELATSYGTSGSGAPGPEVIDFEAPVTPVLDVQQTAKVHSRWLNDGWAILTAQVPGANPGLNVFDVDPWDFIDAVGVAQFQEPVREVGQLSAWLVNSSIAVLEATRANFQQAGILIEQPRLMQQPIGANTEAQFMWDYANGQFPWSVGGTWRLVRDNGNHMHVQRRSMAWPFRPGDELRLAVNDIAPGTSCLFQMLFWVGGDGGPPPCFGA